MGMYDDPKINYVVFKQPQFLKNVWHNLKNCYLNFVFTESYLLLSWGFCRYYVWNLAKSEAIYPLAGVCFSYLKHPSGTRNIYRWLAYPRLSILNKHFVGRNYFREYYSVLHWLHYNVFITIVLFYGLKPYSYRGWVRLVIVDMPLII